MTIDSDLIKNKIIPKVSPEQFTYDKWNAKFCINFYDMCDCDSTREMIKEHIIGWCRASRLPCRPKYDDESIAIYLDDDTWCHLPTWAIKDEMNDNRDFWKFEGYEHIKKE